MGNFWPFGWYGMKGRANLPSWLQKAGYRTALIGKWLNGYGSATSAARCRPASTSGAACSMRRPTTTTTT